jgi:hypothetical protein
MADTIRVLFEHENPRALTRHATALRKAGFHVETCPGPAAFPYKLCPLVIGEGCPAVERADVIVNALPLGRIDVFIAQRRNVPDTPVQLTLSEEQRSSMPLLTKVADIIPRALAPEELVTVVRRAYDEHGLA